jgi:hypothetical protein
LIVLERALKDVIVGDVAKAASPTFTPGTALSSAPAARVAGIAWMVSLLRTISR